MSGNDEREVYYVYVWQCTNGDCVCPVLCVADSLQNARLAMLKKFYSEQSICADCLRGYFVYYNDEAKTSVHPGRTWVNFTTNSEPEIYQCHRGFIIG